MTPHFDMMAWLLLGLLVGLAFAPESAGKTAARIVSGYQAYFAEPSGTQP